MQMQEESLLWNDLPSVPIEDQIAAAVQGIHPQQTGLPGTGFIPPTDRRTVYQQPDQYQRNPDGTFTRILRESERIAAATSAFIAPAQDGTLIRCATDIFRGYLELMAVGQMNRNIPAAIHEAVKNAKYLISLTGSK